MSKTRTANTVQTATMAALTPPSQHRAVGQLTASSLPGAPAAYSTIGLVVGTAAPAVCLVTFPENPGPEALPALLLSHVPTVAAGQSVLLQFVGADLSRPVVLGVIASAPASQAGSAVGAASPAASTVQLQVHGQTLTVLAEQRLELRCGKASLVLEADGNIELRGTDVLSRASGQNSMRGASVSLN